MSMIYNRAKKKGLDTLVSSTIKAMLVNSSYVANPDHDFVSEASSAELSGTGYVGGFGGSGRKTLATKVSATDDALDRGYFDADDLVWSAINAGTAAAMILYIQGSSDADSELLAYIDSGFPQATNGADLTVQFSSSPLGIIQVGG